MKSVDSIIVSFDSENTVMLVGRKAPKKDVEVINAFQGEEARELYRKLTEKRESIG